MLQSAKVNLLRQFEAFAVAFSKPDQFLEPGGASRLDMQAGAKTRQGFPHRAINREFIAAGMDAEFERGGQSISLDGESDYRQIVIEFLFELHNVAHVIDAFIKAAGKLRRDGLQRNAFIRKGREDHQKFRGVCGASVSSIETSVINFPSPLICAI